MSIDMQRLILKEIMDELSNINRILNDDCDKVNKQTEITLSKIYRLLTEEDEGNTGQTNS